MRIARIENDQFILPLGDDIEYVSYDADMLTEDFVELLSQHGWDDESIIEALQNQIEYIKSKANTTDEKGNLMTPQILITAQPVIDMIQELVKNRPDGIATCEKFYEDSLDALLKDELISEYCVFPEPANERIALAFKIPGFNEFIYQPLIVK